MTCGRFKQHSLVSLYVILKRLFFVFDIVFNEIPAAVFITVYDKLSVIYPIVLCLMLVFVCLLVRTEPALLKIEDLLVSDEPTGERIDERVIRLGINGFRSSVVLISSIVILAVDFPIFPLTNHKTDYFGIALMDVGVGFIIICHSMRLIRNSDPSEDHTIKISFSQYL